MSLIFFMLSRDNKRQAAIDLLNGKAFEVFSESGVSMAELVRVNKENAEEAAQKADRTCRTTGKMSDLLFIGTVCLSIFIAGVLVRMVVVPVRKLEKAAESVARGNFDVLVEINRKDEIGNLARSFNQMTTSLCDATQKMQDQANELQSRHKELQKTNLELEEKSHTLEQQKAEIEHENV